MLTFTVEELIRFLSNWTMTFFEGAKRSGDIVFSRYYSFFKRKVIVSVSSGRKVLWENPLFGK